MALKIGPLTKIGSERILGNLPFLPQSGSYRKRMVDVLLKVLWWLSPCDIQG